MSIQPEKGLLPRFIYWLTHLKLLVYMEAVKTVFRYSWLSLLVIGLLIALSWFGQGQTLFIDLMDHNWVNLLLFFLLLDGMAMILSHHPIYMEKWYLRSLQKKVKILDDVETEATEIEKDKPPYVWHIDNTRVPIPWLKGLLNWFHLHVGLGFVTFKYVGGQKGHEKGPVYESIKFIRKLFGVAVYLGFLNLLVISFVTVEGTAMAPGLIFWPLALFIIYVFFRIQQLPDPDGDCDVHGAGDGYLRGVDISFYASWVLRIALIVGTMTLGWSPVVVVMAVLVLMADIVKFSFFRRYRTKMSPQFGILTFYRSIKDHTTFLFAIALTGFLSLTVVVYAHFAFFRVSSLLIILAYLNIIYGLFVLPIKAYLLHRYLQSKKDRRNRWSNVVVSTVPVLSLLLFIYAVWAFNQGNQLHSLPMVAQDEKELVTGDEYIDALLERFGPDSTMYFIASYGGGLKANAWNMLLMDTLAGKGILRKTAAISGVSGGSLGQVFYTGLYKDHAGDRPSIREKAARVATSDFLSIDAAYTLGWDFLREFVVGDRTLGPDRAILSMNEYARMTGGDTMLDLSFQQYWAGLFRSAMADSVFYPAILSNSAGTHIQRGIASSVQFGLDFHSIFHDATDILSFRDPCRAGKSIPYAYAVSAANRFPVFSPAAKIEEKGHFVDGGYFENSGLGSLLDLYEYIKGQLGADMPRKVVFLQIANSVQEYIRSCIDTLGVHKQIAESSEISSVLGTVTSIDMMPRYLIQKARADTTIIFKSIHLPYKFDRRDVDKLYKGSVSLDRREINLFIERHNAELDSIIRAQTNTIYEVVPPPLSRMLGKQGYRYMEVMLDRVMEGL